MLGTPSLKVEGVLFEKRWDFLEKNGTIYFKVEIDSKEAQEELNRLNTRIERLRYILLYEVNKYRRKNELINIVD